MLPIADQSGAEDEMAYTGMSDRDPAHLPNLAAPVIGDDSACSECDGSGKDAASGEHYAEQDKCQRCAGSGDEPTEPTARVHLNSNELFVLLDALRWQQVSIAKRPQWLGAAALTAMRKLTDAMVRS